MVLVVERQEEKRANIVCVCVIAYRKFQQSGISGEVTSSRKSAQRVHSGIGKSGENVRRQFPCSAAGLLLVVSYASDPSLFLHVCPHSGWQFTGTGGL